MTKNSLFLKTQKPSAAAILGLAVGAILVLLALILLGGFVTMVVFHMLNGQFASIQAFGYVESLAITVAVSWFGNLFNNGLSLKTKSE